MEQVFWNYEIRDDFELPGMVRRTHRIEGAIIQTGMQDNTSNAVDLRGYSVIGLAVPPLDNANLTFYVSETETGAYRIINNSDGTPWVITAGTGDRAIDTDGLGGLSAYRWVIIEVSADQSAERVFHFLVKG